ncbi:MAG: 6-hydroxymethylpterin diphosphokinase MptE-like protein [Arcobacteraceae bacterium]
MSLENAQEQLQNALVTTFLANLAFLSEYDNRLYQRVDALSLAINTGAYKENCSLEFLKEEGDFDVYDHKNKRYLYNKKPQKYNRNALHSVDFTSKGSFSLFEPLFFQGKQYTTVFDEVEYFCDFDYSQRCLANDILPYVKVLENNIGDYRFKKFKYIDKFMFIGTKLGRHIPLILEKTQAKTFFVCEANLEIFRLSLFVVDYSNLAREGKTAVFSIMDDVGQREAKLEIFFMNRAHENYMIKYFTTDDNVEEYFNHILTLSLAFKGTSFTYHMMLENIFKNVTQRINHYPVLQFNSDCSDSLKDTPVLFLAAGPSLHENIQWVKEHQDKFIIVSIGAVNKTLIKHGIHADIIATVDPQFKVLNHKQFDDVTVKSLQESFLMASMNTDQRILDKFKKENIFLYETNKPLHSNNICHKGVSVGEMAASMLVGLKFKNVYLLGLDLALNQKTGDTHMQGYSRGSYDEDFKNKRFTEQNDFISLDKELIEVKGNFDTTVYTNRLFALSINSLNSNIAISKQKNQTIYNLSSHGAFFEGTLPCRIDAIEIESFKTLERGTLKDQLKTFLNKMSKTTLSKEDRESLIKELEYLVTLKTVIEEFQDTPSKSFEVFDERIKKLIDNFLFPKVQCSFLLIVFMHFFNVSLQYIYYCLNTQKIKNEQSKIQKVEAVFLEQLNNLLEKYITYLKQI